MAIKLTGNTLNDYYAMCSLHASVDIYEGLYDFYNTFDGCAFE